MKEPRLVRARLFWGESMLVTLPEPLSQELFLYGFHERATTRFMIDRILPGATVLDVGAHIGYYTLLAAHLVGPGGSVHAFEPTPSTASILMRNVARKSNVVINQSAAWDHETELEIQDFGPRRSMSNSVFAPPGWHGMGTMVRVPAIPLDDYVEKLGLVPGFIKIDTESAEPYVIEGLSNTLRRHRPTLTLEVGEAPPGQSISSPELLRTICEQYDYEPFEFIAGEPRPHTVREHYRPDNIALIPAGMAHARPRR